MDFREREREAGLEKENDKSLSFSTAFKRLSLSREGARRRLEMRNLIVAFANK